MKLLHGVSYYPDLWPESEIARDIELMKSLGIDMVRLGDFAWSKMEPEEGKISLEFHRRVVDRLHAAGIRAVFCTPTAGPPIWLTHGHPERCFTPADGRPMSHGSRQHASYEHPVVRDACLRIAEAIGVAFGDHPGVECFQIDNELKCHVDQDFNPWAVAGFRRFLEARFGTIDALNDAWHTGIWSVRYQSFDQIPPPLPTPFAHSNSLVNAWLEFTYERISAFCEEQAAVIRRHSIKPITHNTHLFFPIGFERLFRRLDFASFDTYSPATSWHRTTVLADLFRPTCGRSPFWVMETSCAHNGYSLDHEPMHPPGYLAAEAMTFFAGGAGAFAYWLWRAMPAGVEMPHSAVLNAWGTPQWGAGEVKRVSETLAEHRMLLESTTPAVADVVITWSDRARNMFRSEPLGSNKTFKLDYRESIERIHRLLLEAHLPREIRFEGDSLDGVKLLITPTMPCVDDEYFDRAEAFVRAGGVWICGPLTGYRTAEQTSHLETGLFKRLEQLAGVETVFSHPLTGTNAEADAFEARAPLAGWCFGFRPRDVLTRTLGVVRGPHADGMPFITTRKVDRGTIILVGAIPQESAGDAMVSRLISHAASIAGVRSRFTTSPGTIAYERRDSRGKSTVLAVNLDGKGGELLAGGQRKAVAPFGVATLEIAP